MERYRAGTLTTPQKRLQAALVEETESERQPQVRAQLREQASTASGMMVDVTAHFGFVGKGSSDDERERSITTDISPTYAKQILELQAAGATDEGLHPLVEAITDIVPTHGIRHTGALVVTGVGSTCGATVRLTKQTGVCPSA
ncbi:hypothetical protein ACQEVM_36890 [Streptomyces sp. CA-243310]|uniref:hypothetical protein n=1 Tax=Streptomyces sp. CA-243310 TaxID=3240056 RepID=UPI003D93232C